MASPLRNLLLGATAAMALALVLIVQTVDGVSTWKYLLAAIGAALVVLSGLSKSR